MIQSNNKKKPSNFIDIYKLECESRKFLYAGFCFAILFHAFLALFITYERIDIKPDQRRIIELRLIETTIRFITVFLILSTHLLKALDNNMELLLIMFNLTWKVCG